MKYELHPDALTEYREAARYYADCQAGLKQRFITAVPSMQSGKLSKLQSSGEFWKTTYGDV